MRQVLGQVLRWAAMIAALPAALVLAALVPMWLNDAELASMTDRLLAHPLPPGTEFSVHGAQSSVGLMVGNSNHCDFLVRLSLRTDLPEAEIASYYREIGGSVYAQLGDPESVVVQFLEMRDPGWDLRCH
jgi:hypothetical protein